MRKNSIIAGVAAAAIVILLVLMTGGEDEPEQLAGEGTSEETEDPRAAAPTTEREEFEDSETAEPQTERAAAPQDAVSQQARIGIVDLDRIILKSAAGAQLEQGYRELYQKATSGPNSTEQLEKLTQVNSKVVSQLLVDLRQVIGVVGEREGFDIVLSQEGEIATAPYVNSELEDPVGVLTSTDQRINLNDKVLAEFNKLFEEPGA